MYKKVAASTKSGKGSGGEAGANAGADGGGKREEAVPWSFEALPFDAAQRFVQTSKCACWCVLLGDSYLPAPIPLLTRTHPHTSTVTSDKIYVAFRRADGDLTKFMCLDMEPCLAVPLFQRNLFKEFLCLYLLDPWGQHYNKPGICLRRQLIYFRTTNTESFCRSTTGRAGELTAEEAGEAMLCAWALAGVGGTKKRGRTKATAARRASLLSDASQDAPAAYSGDRSSAASSTTAGGRSGGDGKSMGGKNAASYIENRPGAASAAQVFGKATDLRASPKSSSSTIIARMGTESLESVVYRLASAADVKEKKRKVRLGGFCWCACDFCCLAH